MTTQRSTVVEIERAAAADEFSLFDNEEAVLGRTEVMLARLAEVAQGVQELAGAYRRGYREQRRLVRMSDRMQGDLQRANLRLADQQRDLQSLNEALSGEIEHRTRLEASCGGLPTRITSPAHSPAGASSRSASASGCAPRTAGTRPAC